MNKRNERKVSVIINGKEQYVRKVTNRNGEDQFQWVTPEANKNNRLSLRDRIAHQKRKLPLLPMMKKRIKHTNNKQRGRLFTTRRNKALQILKKVWLSAASAIFIGTTFGVLILMMFSGDNIFPQDAAGKSQTDTASVVATSAEKVDLALSLPVIQGGAFETSQPAEAIAKKIREQGFAAAIDMDDDPIRMYVGVSSSKEKLTAIATEYEKQAGETYIKELAIEPSIEVDEKATEVLANGKQYLQSMITEVEALFHGETTAEVSKTSDTHRKSWEQSLEQVDGQDFHDFSEALEKSFASLSQLRENNSETEFWQIQQKLLHSLLSYKKLITKTEN